MVEIVPRHPSVAGHFTAAMHAEKLAMVAKAVSEQTALAAVTFLSSTVPCFAPATISHGTLHNLVLSHNQTVVFQADPPAGAEDSDEHRTVYRAGVDSDLFTLVLEGCLIITVSGVSVYCSCACVPFAAV